MESVNKIAETGEKQSIALGRCSGGLPASVKEKQASADDEERIGDVEVGPAPIVVGLPKDPIAHRMQRFTGPGDSVQSQAIIKIAKNADSDATEGEGQPGISGGAINEQPNGNRDGGEDTESGKNPDFALPEAKKRPLVQTELNSDVVGPKPPNVARAKCRRREEDMLCDEVDCQANCSRGEIDHIPRERHAGCVDSICRPLRGHDSFHFKSCALQMRRGYATVRLAQHVRMAHAVLLKLGTFDAHRRVRYSVEASFGNHAITLHTRAVTTVLNAI